MLFPFETSISQNQTLELRDNVCFFIIYLLQICQLINWWNNITFWLIWKI